MATFNKGFRKLVDLRASNIRQRKALDAFLEQHNIEYRNADFWREDVMRYFVRPVDLCCAQAVLGAVKELGE